MQAEKKESLVISYAMVKDADAVDAAAWFTSKRDLEFEKDIGLGLTF